MMPRPRQLPAARAAAVSAAVLLAGCGASHHLSEYAFAGRPLAVVDTGTPAPVLLTGGSDVDADDPLGAVIEAGSRAAEEVEGRRARARLDSAAARLDVGRLMGGRIQERAARYLGSSRADDADASEFLLEVDVDSYGIDARGGDDALLFVRAEAVLLETATGREIWSSVVRGRDRLTPSLAGLDRVPGGAVTAGVLSSLGVDDFERILRQVVEVSADAVTDRLRSDLREAREG